MGASGSGKTTLLNAITMRNVGELKVSGDVKINGQRIQNLNQLATISGYVQQNEVFFVKKKLKKLKIINKPK